VNDNSSNNSSSSANITSGGINGNTSNSINNGSEVGSLQPPMGNDYKSLTYQEVFYLATMGGATVLRMDKVVGNFIVGKKLDCLGTMMIVMMMNEILMMMIIRMVDSDVQIL